MLRTTTHLVTYEQPINELMRACLRLEYLFDQALHHLHGQSEWDNRHVVSAIINIAALLDRSDLKSKLHKELLRHRNNLMHLAQTPGIDISKLETLMGRLESLQQRLNSSEGRLGQELQSNDFLNSIRQYIHNPAGACNFDVPVYHAWLHQPLEQRTQQMTQWLQKFDTMRTIVELLLQMIRESAIPESLKAEKGCYHEPLDSNAPTQLVQVILDSNSKTFPEISAGKHRINIRFVQFTGESRGESVCNDVYFQLNRCVI